MGSAILPARIARFVALTAISEDLNMCEATGFGGEDRSRFMQCDSAANVGLLISVG